jgi:hypothetical protein
MLMTGFKWENVSSYRGQEDVFTDKCGPQDAEKSMDYITKMLQLFFNEDWFLCRTVYKIAG